MKRITMISLLVFFLFGVGKSIAQEKTAVTVKGSELNNGVVIVDLVKAGKSYELQCNQGAPSCTPLKSGKYQMVELPSNVGMYECRDVEVYVDDSSSSDTGKKIGEYCLTAK